MAIRSSVGNMKLNPFVLVAGTVGVPLLVNTIGRGIFTQDPAAANADVEFRRISRNFAIYNAVVAAGLAYATTRVKDERLQSAALGGAIGTALIAGTLGTALLTAPSQEELAKQRQENAQKALLPALLAAQQQSQPAWVSNLIGYRG